LVLQNGIGNVIFVIAAVIFALLYYSIVGAYVAFGVYYVALSLITFSHILAFSPPKRQESESVPHSHSTSVLHIPSSPSKRDPEYGSPLSTPNVDKSIEENENLSEDQKNKISKDDKPKFQKFEEVSSSSSNED
jgi:hypothetical protein